MKKSGVCNDNAFDIIDRRNDIDSFFKLWNFLNNATRVLRDLKKQSCIIGYIYFAFIYYQTDLYYKIIICINISHLFLFLFVFLFLNLTSNNNNCYDILVSHCVRF